MKALAPLLIIAPAAALAAVIIGDLIPVSSDSSVRMPIYTSPPSGMTTEGSNALAFVPTTGKFLAAFGMPRSATSPAAIYSSAIDANAASVTARTILDTTSYMAQEPAIAWNPSNHRFLLVFGRMSMTSSSASTEVRGLVLDENGLPLGGSVAGFRIYDPLTKAPCRPVVACDGTNWMVVWQEYFDGGDIYHRVVGAASTNTAPVFLSNPAYVESSSTSEQASIAFNTYDKHVVVFCSTLRKKIQVRTVATGGGAISPAPGTAPNDVATVTAVNVHPVLAVSGTRRDLLAGWIDTVAGVGTVSVRRITPLGLAVDAVVPIPNAAGAGALANSLVMTWNEASGQFLLTWFEDPLAADNLPIGRLRLARLRESDLAVLENVVVEEMANVSTARMVACAASTTDSTALVLWQRSAAGATTYPLEARRINLGAHWGTPVLGAIEQRRLDNDDVLEANGRTSLHGFTARVSVHDPQGRACEIQVEVKESSSAFDGYGLRTSATSFGETDDARFRIEDLALDKSWHWRARLRNADGRTSAWASSGNGVDFSTISNQVPAVSGLAQLTRAGDVVETGETIFDQSIIRLQAIVTDPEGRDLRMELRLTRVDLSGAPSWTLWSPAVHSGGTVALDLALDDGSYRWEARAVDDVSDASPWSELAAPGTSHFGLHDHGGSTAASSCLHSAGGPATGPVIAAMLVLVGAYRLFLVR